ncbi:hypothetical protein K469DRAFT_685075 [Zopfia rhizophila CBS 207.26]|uniref:Hemerythrin-like domain-containing protein n=1 Tax=Zopfia rhizophila CBS 207.26 TaxID=1314779 RepID=A0A6A6E909_9PEZI|nr:hypothetical protein K469DRAFT_685075 [Zopfia rhizophila CBS 207.26]
MITPQRTRREEAMISNGQVLSMKFARREAFGDCLCCPYGLDFEELEAEKVENSWNILQTLRIVCTIVSFYACSAFGAIFVLQLTQASWYPFSHLPQKGAAQGCAACPVWCVIGSKLFGLEKWNEWVVARLARKVCGELPFSSPIGWRQFCSESCKRFIVPSCSLYEVCYGAEQIYSSLQAPNCHLPNAKNPKPTFTCSLLEQISTSAKMADAEPQNAPTVPQEDSQAPQPPSTPPPPEPSLPKLSPAEFRAYNHMAEHMDYFHNRFRQTWTLISTACENQKRPKGMSIRQFLSTGLEFCHHLTMHHTLEENHLFPILAKKMPAFRKELELLSQHKQIHNGLEKMEEYLEACRIGESELRLSELKEILDGFGEVLWQHLDDEVRQLRAENMRKYWSLEEMRRMPM